MGEKEFAHLKKRLVVFLLRVRQGLNRGVCLPCLPANTRLAGLVDYYIVCIFSRSYVVNAPRVISVIIQTQLQKILCLED